MVRYEIAYSGTKEEVLAYVQGNPGKSSSEAKSDWMISKYLPWIEDRIGDPIAFEPNPDLMYFEIAFESPEQEAKFLRIMGGKVVQ